MGSGTFWASRRVLVTGGAGFIGSNLVERLLEMGASVRVVDDLSRGSLDNLEGSLEGVQFWQRNLTSKETCVDACCDREVVFHLAARVGGIGYYLGRPYEVIAENVLMDILVLQAALECGVQRYLYASSAHVMEAARLVGVEKFVGIGTACSYPGYLEGHLKEDNLWDGIPHETVVNYGLTKKMMAIQGWAYKRQYGFNAIHLILTNLYGPWDTFNPDRSHIVAALIRKFVEARQAGKPEVEVWGTGKPVREFLYGEDCAEAIVRAAEVYDDISPLNIGCGQGTSIREMVDIVNELSGFEGQVIWNTDKPDDQMVKVLDVTKMKQALRWAPPTSLRDGLRKTIDWYVANKVMADMRV